MAKKRSAGADDSRGSDGADGADGAGRADGTGRADGANRTDRTERARGADRARGAERRVALRLGVFRWVFLLSMLRMFAAPATEDFFDEQLVPWPTWDWVLCALVPVLLIYVSRRPDDWRNLREDHSLIKWALVLYLFYALLGAIGMGHAVLWIAVATSLAGLAWMWHLNHKEQARAA
ncbi:hypothetical protein AB0N81_26495 [Streptomyces sp. NPDC093510]|uniref:hypothetical protein n=1 Tax=Streptomyces sp. NPDC093510 TaxID=3155199 RepID=UPI0034133D78